MVGLTAVPIHTGFLKSNLSMLHAAAARKREKKHEST
jgi:hypothetical protein